jgi:hypothetical protein
MTDRLEIATRIACAIVQTNPPMKLEWANGSMTTRTGSDEAPYRTIANVALGIADALIEAESDA